MINLLARFCDVCGAKRFPRGGCKSCKRAYQKRWKLANPEKSRIYNQARDHKHHLEYIRTWIRKNPEKRRRYSLAYRSKNREKIMWAATKRRAAKLEIAFDLEISDLTIPEFCPALGIKLRVGAGVSCNMSPTVDRIIPSLGYTRGNVAVISRLANQFKSNATADQLRRIANWIDTFNKDGS